MRVYEIKSSSRNAFEKRIEAAKASTLRLTNAKQILDIEYTDLKLLLSYNPEFFDHCMKVADKVVAQIISSYKEMYADSEYENTLEQFTLFTLLNQEFAAQIIHIFQPYYQLIHHSILL